MSKNKWDALAKSFTFDPNDENYSGASENVLFLWPAILKYLSKIKGKIIIDFGCGAGTFCNHLYNNDAQVIGIDESSAMLDFARGTNPNINFFQTIDNAPDHVDYVTSIHAFEFIRDIEVLISKIFTHLNSDGIFIFAVHDKFFLDNFAKMNGSFIPSEAGDCMYDFGDVKIPIFSRTVDFYEDLLLKTGFSNIEIDRPLYSEEFKVENDINPQVKNWAVVIKAQK